MSANAHPLDVSTLRRICRIPDIAWASFWEGALILVAGATALWSGHPWLFTALGPVAYEIVERPELPSARPYNIIVGHFIGMGAGFAAVALLGAWKAPTTNAHNPVIPVRLWCAVIAVVLTVSLNLLLRSGQPAALSTTLLVALGNFQTAHAALWLASGVLIVEALGEPLRRIRLHSLGLRQQRARSPFHCPIAAPASPPHNLAA